MASKTTTTNPALEALERRRAAREQRASLDGATIELTPEQEAITGALRERDHLEGCPELEKRRGRVEAFTEAAIAPTKGLVDRGVKPGETVVVVRCQECGGSRYIDGVTTVDAFIDRRLEELAGITEPAELDNTL